jgi:hypothetical protein
MTSNGVKEVNYNFAKDQLPRIHELIRDMDHQPGHYAVFFTQNHVAFKGIIRPSSCFITILERDLVGTDIGKHEFRQPQFLSSYSPLKRTMSYHSWFNEIKPVVECYNRLMDCIEDHIELAVEEFTHSYYKHFTLQEIVKLYNRNFKVISDPPVYIKDGKAVAPQPMYTFF